MLEVYEDQSPHERLKGNNSTCSTYISLPAHVLVSHNRLSVESAVQPLPFKAGMGLEQLRCL